MRNVDLPLRIGVGVVVINKNNKIFVAKRLDNKKNWQMPQGGVNNKELFLDAMKRELFEETGIKNIKIVKELDYWLEYNLPENLIGLIWRGKYKGQKQKWFIVKFEGKDSEINLNTENPEFIEWKWIDIKDLPQVIVSFKKHIYLQIVKELDEFIG
jgi:putative (di)nucleoside polyphosphate hydrolase